MLIKFHVNNPEFGMLHLNSDDAQDPSISDVERIPRQVVIPGPEGRTLVSKGFQKGDLIIVEMSEDFRTILSFRKPTESEQRR